jgi:hypothetical protein
MRLSPFERRRYGSNDKGLLSTTGARAASATGGLQQLDFSEKGYLRKPTGPFRLHASNRPECFVQWFFSR